MATNSKITDLTAATTPLQGGDLIPIVQTQGGNSVTRKASVANLLAAVASTGSTTKVVYQGGDTAIEATDSQINVTNTAGDSYMVFDPSDSSLALKAGNCSLAFNSDGFAFNHQNVDATTGVASEAWQIRLNSDDTYLTSNNDVEIVGGAKSTSAKKLLMENLDKGGRVRLLSGGKMSLYSNDRLDINAYSLINIKATSITSDSGSVVSGTSTVRTIHGLQKALRFKEDLEILELSTQSIIRTITTTANGDQDMVDTTDFSGPRNSIIFHKDDIKMETPEMTFHIDNELSFIVGDRSLYITGAVIDNINYILNSYSSMTQVADVIITSDLSNCTVSGTTLTATANGAFMYNGNAIAEGAWIFFNISSGSQTALNGLCKLQSAGSDSSQWYIVKTLTPYIVDVTATYNTTQSGIYIRSTTAAAATTLYKKM